MPFTIKILDIGILGTGGAPQTLVLYSAPSTASGGAGAIVSNVRLVNTSGAAVTVNVVYRPSGGSTTFRILEKDKSIAAGDILIIKPELTLGPGDKLELPTIATSGVVEFVVSGMEKS